MRLIILARGLMVALSVLGIDVVRRAAAGLTTEPHTVFKQCLLFVPTGLVFAWAFERLKVKYFKADR